MEGVRDSYKIRVAAESPYTTGTAKVKIFQKVFQVLKYTRKKH